jgi:Uma2 family endonuclease
MIIEVLSPAAEARDRVEKRIAYQKVSALQEYVLVSQERLQIEILRRVEQGWEVETCASGDRVGFRSISLEASMKEIYADVIKLLWKKA